MMDSEVTLFPHSDSPTIAMVSPCPIAKLTRQQRHLRVGFERQFAADRLRVIEPCLSPAFLSYCESTYLIIPICLINFYANSIPEMDAFG
ncbi:hypothetical protein D3C87_1105960 [compost metagenome]